MKEKNIKKFNQTLYNDLLVFNECNFLPFIFISIHNFLIDKNLNPIVYDFGIHKLLLSQEEYTSYVNVLPTIANMLGLDYDPRYYVGQDLFSDNYQSIVVFADGSWKNEIAYYNSSKNDIKYYTDKTYTADEIALINKTVQAKIDYSNKIVKNNYFEDLNNKITEKKQVYDELSKIMCLNSDIEKYKSTENKSE